MDIKIGNTITVFIPFDKLGIDSANEIKSIIGSFVIRNNRHTHHNVPVLSPTEYTIREYGCPVYNKMPANAHCCAEHPIHGFSVYKDTDPAIVGNVITVVYPGYLQHITGEFDVVLEVTLSKKDGKIIKSFNNLFALSEENYVEDKPSNVIVKNNKHDITIDNKTIYNGIVIYDKTLLTTGTFDNFVLNLNK